MRKKIAVVTATRAEYGLLSGVIRELRTYESDDLKVCLVVTGTHLSDKYGRTIEEIQKDGLRIDTVLQIALDSGSELDISVNQADALVTFTRHFMEEKYSAVLLLGDRYEIMAIAMAAGNTRTPVFHMCGGDTTEGALDEWIRHSVTKISYLHFVTNEESRRRVVQLGEDPARVYNYGSTSVDQILHTAGMTKKEALESIGLEECRYALCTYHPVTMEEEDIDDSIHQLLEAIQQFPDIQFIVTKSNADQGGMRINEILDREAGRIANLHVFASLGIRRYLSLMRYAVFVLGNSSSGIIEAPALHVPTVNIGDRQRGRLQIESIMNCGSNTDDIVKAIRYVSSDECKERCKRVVSPYGDGHAAERIAKKVIETVIGGQIDLKKSFYDIAPNAKDIRPQ